MPEVVYGPVPSWRYGWVIGVDIILPPKTCTFNCIYCQLGETIFRISKPEEYEPRVTPEMVSAGLRNILSRVKIEEVSTINVTGFGEPTLNRYLGKICEIVASHSRGLKTIIQTNTSTLWMEDVVKSLRSLDQVIVKIDTLDEKMFRAINEPHPSITIDMIKDGLKNAIEILGPKKVTLQCMLISKPFSNAKAEYLKPLVELVNKYGIERVELNTPLRPTRISSVEPLSPLEMKKAIKYFMDNVKHSISIVNPYETRELITVPKTISSLISELSAILMRRPADFETLKLIFDVPEEDLRRALSILVAKGEVQEVTYRGKKFYRTIVEYTPR